MQLYSTSDCKQHVILWLQHVDKHVRWYTARGNNWSPCVHGGPLPHGSGNNPAAAGLGGWGVADTSHSSSSSKFQFGYRSCSHPPSKWWLVAVGTTCACPTSVKEIVTSSLLSLTLPRIHAQGIVIDRISCVAGICGYLHKAMLVHVCGVYDLCE